MSDLMSIDPSGISKAFKVGKAVHKIFKSYQRYRVDTFIKTVDTCYEQMTEEKRLEFQAAIQSEHGQKITSDFVITVTMTPSLIVNAALALLYAKDPEFDFNESQIERFVSAVNGLTDRQVNFYLKVFDCISNKDYKPYPAYTINQDNFYKVSEFADQDEVFIYIYDFLSRGLVITTDNNNSPSKVMGNSYQSGQWKAKYCLSDTHKRYRALLNKAKELMR